MYSDSGQPSQDPGIFCSDGRQHESSDALRQHFSAQMNMNVCNPWLLIGINTDNKFVIIDAG